MHEVETSAKISQNRKIKKLKKRVPATVTVSAKTMLCM